MVVTINITVCKAMVCTSVLLYVLQYDIYISGVVGLRLLRGKSLMLESMRGFPWNKIDKNVNPMQINHHNSNTNNNTCAIFSFVYN